MKKEIQDHVIFKNNYYSLMKEDGEKIEGLVTDIKVIDDVAEDDFNILIEFEGIGTKKFHSNEVIDILKRDLDPSV